MIITSSKMQRFYLKQGGRSYVHLQEGQVEGEEGDGGRQPQQETESGGPS